MGYQRRVHGSNSSTINIMRLIILTLSALLAFAVAEREFNLCAREEKVCPGGVKPKTPCADGSQPKCPSGRTDTCKPKWKRCADRSEPVRQCATVPSNMTHTLLTGCLHYPNGRGYNPLRHYISTRSGRDDETGKARVDHNSSCKSNGLKA